MKMETNKIYNMDCLEGMKQLPDESVDLVVTDPPYNASNSKLSFKDKHYTCVNEKWDKGFTIEFFDECVKKLKIGGQMLIFCSYHLLGTYLQKNNLKLQQIIHWTKKNPVPSFTKVYAPSVEYCLWFVKTGKAYTFNKNKRFSFKNVFETNVNGWKHTKHPTEKHIEIIKSLVQTHSNEQDLVLDCFMGSGTTAVACIQTGRNFIGYEINKEYYDIAVGRIQSAKSQTQLSNESCPNGEFNKDLTATQQVASPKCPSDTSLNPNLSAISKTPSLAGSN
jgi:site-specific DNA-methyltransferase (adenine-specific)